MESYLKGRVRNLNLSPKRCLQPVFEAMMNSLQAIDDRAASGWTSTSGRIRIVVIRDKQQGELFDPGIILPVREIQIEDNGIGFDDKHFAAFERLDDDFRIDKGGKGVGRLSWLSAFQQVDVSSVYREGPDSHRKRTFEYTIDADGVTNESDDPCDDVDQPK